MQNKKVRFNITWQWIFKAKAPKALSITPHLYMLLKFLIRPRLWKFSLVMGFLSKKYNKLILKTKNLLSPQEKRKSDKR